MSHPYEYDLPDRFNLYRANHMERVKSDDGERTYVVLESHLRDEKTVVREEIVEYDSRLEHPATKGVAGFLALLVAIGAPLFAGYHVAEYLVLSTGTTSAWLYIYGTGVLATAIGIKVSEAILYNTTAGQWVTNFEEWNANRSLIMGARAA